MMWKDSDLPDGTSLWLWEVIESANRSLRQLCRRLETMDGDQLRRYCREYDEAKGWVNPCYCPEFHPSERCPEDFGDDFSVWVVAQGLAFYMEVWKNPERIDEYLKSFELIDLGRGYADRDWDHEADREEYLGWQCPLGVAHALHYHRYGEEC
ncbi:hypothetical protein [Zavarzinella formosa]|uniref:hypothetical protein n=1 Tax=Zavarzinella formosa TaxID=360055 RepID=UPI0003060104|nr:hypothetical protein [Zavarzinella formosa]